MSVQNVNQHLSVIVGTAVVASAVAPAAVGEVGFLVEGAWAVAAPTDKKFQVGVKLTSGDVLMSAVVDPMSVGYSSVDSAYDAPVMKVATLTIPSPVIDDSFTVRLGLPAYGGTISQEDIYYVYASATATTATASDVATELRDSLTKALAKLGKPIGVVSGSGGDIIVTAVPQAYVQGKFAGGAQDFFLELTGTQNLDSVVTAGSPGNGTYAQVAGQEEFFAGYNEDYKNRGADWPANGTPDLLANPAKTYNGTTIIFANTQKGFNDLSQRQILQVWLEA